MTRLLLVPCAVTLVACHAPSQMVLPCNALPAPGTWQDITPAPFRATWHSIP